MIDIEVIRVADAIERHTLQFESTPKVQNVLEMLHWHPISPDVALSVWGKAVSLDTTLASGARLELTRDIKIDPKTARARRVDAKPRAGWVRRSARTYPGDL